jgi:hypothetical protein
MAEQKSVIEIVLMPLVVAIVGIIGTVLITAQQQDNTQALSEAQLKSTEDRSSADRQIRVLEMFVEKITSGNERDRILALKILEELDPGLAAKLASAVSMTETTNTEVSKLAKVVAQDAAVRANKSRVFIHIATEAQRSLALNIARGLGSKDVVVSGVERISNPPTDSQLRYFRDEDKEGAEFIVAALKEFEIKIKPKFTKGYESIARPGDYEIWFAKNNE